MAREIQLPCNGEGVCMRCKVMSRNEETITCTTCITPWHMPCLAPESLASSSIGDLEWLCPDCSGDVDPIPVSGIAGFESSGSDFIAAICAIEANASLTEEMKAKKRQRLMSGKADDGLDEDEKNQKGKTKVVDEDEEMLYVVKKIFSCPICLELAKRPITTSCGHNFCLKCFEKWIGQGKFECAKCRTPIPKTAARNICINLALAAAIRLAKNLKRAAALAPKVQHHIQNEDLLEEAYTTERAVKLAYDSNTEEKKRMRKARKATRINTIREKLLKQFSCQICRKVMSLPLTTPCGHNFCKECLGAKFAGIAHVRERSSGGHTLRAKKNIMICPSCPMDIADFLQNPQVNREIMDVIEKLTKKEEEEPAVTDDASSKEGEENSEKTTDANSGGNTGSEDDDEEEGEGEEEEEEEGEEEEDEDEFDIDVSEAEELPRKRMKLDSDTLSSSHCKSK